jgi:hypothetical protein
LARANINVLDAVRCEESVSALRLWLRMRYVLATKHLNADATGSCYPTPSLGPAGGVLTVFPTVIWVASN